MRRDGDGIDLMDLEQSYDVGRSGGIVDFDRLDELEGFEAVDEWDPVDELEGPDDLEAADDWDTVDELEAADDLDEWDPVDELDGFEGPDDLEAADDWDTLEAADDLDDLEASDDLDEWDPVDELEGPDDLEAADDWDTLDELEASDDLDEWESAGYSEDAEFFGKLIRGAGRLIKKGARFIAKNAGKAFKVVAPIAAKVIGGALGGPAGAALATNVTNAVLREAEGAAESLDSIESVLEAGDVEFLEIGGDAEAALDMEEAATAATRAMTERQADEAIGRMVRSIPQLMRSPRLRPWMPQIMRAAAALAKTLRLNPRTRWMVRLVPLIVRRALISLSRRRRIDAHAVIVAMSRSTAWTLANARRAQAARRHTRRVATNVQRRRAGATRTGAPARRPGSRPVGRAGTGRGPAARPGARPAVRASNRGTVRRPTPARLR